jgi:hypothetical protein
MLPLPAPKPHEPPKFKLARAGQTFSILIGACAGGGAHGVAISSPTYSPCCWAIGARPGSGSSPPSTRAPARVEGGRAGQTFSILIEVYP